MLLQGIIHSIIHFLQGFIYFLSWFGDALEVIIIKQNEKFLKTIKKNEFYLAGAAIICMITQDIVLQTNQTIDSTFLRLLKR